ncbi:MAG: DEAD/DEAH box helicase, partial [Thermoprotei archaeon]
KLGELVSKLYIDPLTADIVIRHLGKAPTYITPLYYLHIIALTPDFGRVRITGYRGLREEALALAEEGYIPLPDEVDVDFWEWLRGFKIARILESWIEEFDEDYIVTRYNIGPGDLATLIDTASWLVHASSVICGATHMREHSKNLEILSMRVEKGVKEDVIELTRIKGIGRVRARILANMGIKTIQDLLKVPERKLAELPTFGEKVAKTIIEEARRILSKYEGSTTH